MQDIELAGLVTPSVAISSNHLSIVTANTDAGRSINNLADLESSDAVVVLCSTSAPCGVATEALLAGVGVSIEAASREPNVRATLTKVLLGEADAAIVYHTDVIATPQLRAVAIDESVNVSVTSRAAAVPGDAVAAAIVELLAGPEAGAVLRTAGFDAP
jgi:molybdate transport system substrate-binding protein